jgi:hypothetical protein
MKKSQVYGLAGLLIGITAFYVSGNAPREGLVPLPLWLDIVTATFLSAGLICSALIKVLMIARRIVLPILPRTSVISFLLLAAFGFVAAFCGYASNTPKGFKWYHDLAGFVLLASWAIFDSFLLFDDFDKLFDWFDKTSERLIGLIVKLRRHLKGA